MTSKIAGSQMPPKRGEGAAKRLKGEVWRLSGEDRTSGPWVAERLRRISDRLWMARDEEGAGSVRFDSFKISSCMGDLEDIAKELESSPSALIAALQRLEGEVFDCEQLEKDYSNRSQKELDDEWITADEIKHRIGGLKFALNLLRSPPTEEVA